MTHDLDGKARLGGAIGKESKRGNSVRDKRSMCGLGKVEVRWDAHVAWVRREAK